MWHDLREVMRRELAAYFGSPVAYLFLAAFLAVILFVFYWVEAFFARNIADVRPLFEWMPLMLIFLVAALTMRAWAEERRAGTLESLLTAPVSPWALILGKFLAGWALVALALALTLPLPLTVAFLGPLDWGPVVGGYLAALLLAGAYLAIGLWASSRTDSQIVALILTVAVAGAFYLVGSQPVAGLVGYRAGEVLRAIGLGSRFEQITRGVLDLRDLYYFVSIAGVFLLLNRWELARLRWAGDPPGRRRRPALAVTWLAALNLLAANLWLDQLGGLRLDLTAGRLYTLSDATRAQLARVREPLLIRGYFSAATHPLLAPLVPQLRDLLEEYAVAGGDRVRVEFVDPHEDPKLEAEAGERYGIRPVPFRAASRYQTSVVNSYFHILVRYGDQYQVLDYEDLIDVKVRGENDLAVALRNPEYVVTAAIRKVVERYRGGGSPFEALIRPVTLHAYLSPAEQLPGEMKAAREALEKSLDELKKEAQGRLEVEFADPGADPALARRLAEKDGLGPMILDLLHPEPFWFSLVLDDGRQRLSVPLPEKLDEAGFHKALMAAVRRFSPGYLKTLAVYAPGGPPPSPFGFNNGGRHYQALKAQLAESVRWVETDLASGRAPADADMLMVLSPQDLDDKQRFAIDQFLMRGGTVLLAMGAYDISVDPSLSAVAQKSGLEDWLADQGLGLERSLVLDERAGALPIPIERSVGGFLIREIQLVDYPFILDVRDDGLNPDSPVTNSLDQLYVPFASPVEVDDAKNAGRKVTWLLRSSARSWTTTDTNLIPDFRRYGRLGFPRGEKEGARTLAVMVEGRFDSAFKGRPSPLLAKKSSDRSQAGKDQTKEQEEPKADQAAGRGEGVIEHSPDGARLILIGSGMLFSDETQALVSGALGTAYRKPALFAQNLVDWSLEDQGLLALRGRDRSRFARTLEPLSPWRQRLWEYLDYALVLIGLGVVWLVHRRRQQRRLEAYRQLLAG